MCAPRYALRGRPATAHAATAQPTADDVVEALRLASATVRLLEALALASRCLMQSLVLSRLLARRGIPGRLAIEVRPGEQFGAHAWIEVGPRAVLEPREGIFTWLVEV